MDDAFKKLIADLSVKLERVRLTGNNGLGQLDDIGMHYMYMYM